MVFLLGGGAVYLLLWIYGLVVGMSTGANFVPFNSADNWLHLFLGVAMMATVPAISWLQQTMIFFLLAAIFLIGLGVLWLRRDPTPAPRAPAQQ